MRITNQVDERPRLTHVVLSVVLDHANDGQTSAALITSPYVVRYLPVNTNKFLQKNEPGVFPPGS
jgi:hypothetical protein